jgi:hypothetical protein
LELSYAKRAVQTERKSIAAEPYARLQKKKQRSSRVRGSNPNQGSERKNPLSFPVALFLAIITSPDI